MATSFQILSNSLFISHPIFRSYAAGGNDSALKYTSYAARGTDSALKPVTYWNKHEVIK